MNMEKLTKQVLFWTFHCAILLFWRPATSQEVDDEREFDYNGSGERGPACWGDLRPEWETCKKGLMQSPVDLLHERVEVVSHFGNLKINYKPSNATLKNRGHDIMIKWVGGGGYMEINGAQYELKQCHWHTPSEHTINGEKFDLEGHLVHESPSGAVAVIGVFYEIGEPDYFLSTISDHLEDISDTNEEKVLNVVDPTALLKKGRGKYYRYIGSLTIPPCTENVTWTIIKELRTVSYEQVKLLRVAVHDDSDTNARPLQALNDRVIQFQRVNQCEHEEGNK